VDAAGTDAPRASWLGERVHRPSHAFRLGAAVAGLALLVLGTVLAPAVAEAVGASLAVLGLLGTVAVDAVRGRRPAVVTAVLGCLLGLVLAAVAERLGDASGGVVAMEPRRKRKTMKVQELGKAPP
jgi:hypothetical protein